MTKIVRITLLMGFIGFALSGCYWTPSGYSDKTPNEYKKPEVDPSQYQDVSKPIGYPTGTATY